jgi:hypothetical protein
MHYIDAVMKENMIYRANALLFKRAEVKKMMLPERKLLFHLD